MKKAAETRFLAAFLYANREKTNFFDCDDFEKRQREEMAKKRMNMGKSASTQKDKKERLVKFC